MMTNSNDDVFAFPKIVDFRLGGFGIKCDEDNGNEASDDDILKSDNSLPDFSSNNRAIKLRPTTSTISIRHRERLRKMALRKSDSVPGRFRMRSDSEVVGGYRSQGEDDDDDNQWPRKARFAQKYLFTKYIRLPSMQLPLWSSYSHSTAAPMHPIYHNLNCRCMLPECQCAVVAR
jgi:hypothetical protein